MGSYNFILVIFGVLVSGAAIILGFVTVRLCGRLFVRHLSGDKSADSGLAAPSLLNQDSDSGKSGSPMSLREALIIASAAAVAAFFFALCFSGRDVWPQFSFVLFCPVAFATLAVSLKCLGLLNNCRALFLSLPLLIVASFNAIFTDNFFTYGNVLAALGLFTLFLLMALSKYPPDPFSRFGLKLFSRAAFGNWGAWFGLIKILAIGGAQKPHAGAWRKILYGALLALPIIVVLTTLLMSADMVFIQLVRDLLGSLIRFDFNRDSFDHLMFATSLAVAWIYFCGYIGQSRKLASIPASRPIQRPHTDALISATFLMLVNLLFLAFSLVQIAYLFNGGFMTLPPGIIYSQYAREGFFQLLAVTVINFLLIMAFLGWMEGIRENRLLRFLLLCLCLFTSVLIASSFYRMSMYTEAYGYTALRLKVITFLSLEVFWVLIIAGHLLQARIPLARSFLATSFIFYLIGNVTGSDYFAARLNVKLLVADRLDSLDTRARAMGIDGLHLIKPLMEDDRYICLDYKIRKKSALVKMESFWAMPPHTLHNQPTDFEDIIDLNHWRLIRTPWQSWSYLKNKSLNSINAEPQHLPEWWTQESSLYFKNTFINLAVAKNVAKASRAYSPTLDELKRQADRGSAEALFMLGVYYADGRGGVLKDLHLASEWYQKAASQGNANAQIALGLMHYYGNAITSDRQTGCALVHQAIEKVDQQKAAQQLVDSWYMQLVRSWYNLYCDS